MQWTIFLFDEHLADVVKFDLKADDIWPSSNPYLSLV